MMYYFPLKILFIFISMLYEYIIIIAVLDNISRYFCNYGLMLTHIFKETMKRNSDMNSGRGGLKRSRQSEEPSLRLLIPSKVAGSIIGKGGKNISRIRSDFNATVQVWINNII